MFTATLFPIAKIWKKPKCPSKKWMDIENVVYIYTHTHIQWNITQPLKKKWNLAKHNMDRPRRHYAKWNKSEKYKHHMISLICGIQKHNKLTNIIKLKQMHKYKEQMIARGEGFWGKNEGERD